MAQRLETALRRPVGAALRAMPAPAPTRAAMSQPQPVPDPLQPAAVQTASPAVVPAFEAAANAGRCIVRGPRPAAPRRRLTKICSAKWPACSAASPGVRESAAHRPPSSSCDDSGRSSADHRDPCPRAGHQHQFRPGHGLTERVIQLVALLTVLSLAPSILVMVTSFTRIVVVLSLLRTALGTGTAPPNAVIVSLALFLTAFVMGPAFQRAYDAGVAADARQGNHAEQAFERVERAVPRVHAEERARKGSAAVHRTWPREPAPRDAGRRAAAHLVPAFMISELQARLRDRVSAVPAVPDHRPGDRIDPDVDGHDDAAAGGRVAAVQADLLRAGRRLESGRGQPGAELRAVAARNGSSAKPAIRAL